MCKWRVTEVIFSLRKESEWGEYCHDMCSSMPALLWLLRQITGIKMNMTVPPFRK